MFAVYFFIVTFPGLCILDTIFEKDIAWIYNLKLTFFWTVLIAVGLSIFGGM